MEVLDMVEARPVYDTLDTAKANRSNKPKWRIYTVSSGAKTVYVEAPNPQQALDWCKEALGLSVEPSERPERKMSTKAILAYVKKLSRKERKELRKLLGIDEPGEPEGSD